MHTTFLTAALLLLGPASAAPGLHPTRLLRRSQASPTDVWVSVDDDGQPKTITPVVSTVSGTTTIISGAPHDVTATVFTRTSAGDVRTSTGSAPVPTATDKAGGGAFPLCYNTEGVNAPFCEPGTNATLHPGTTYYITWDPTFFNTTNGTVIVRGNYINSTTGEILDQAFASDKTPVGYGFYSWSVPKSVLSGQASNISLSIASVSSADSSTSDAVRGPWITVAKNEPYRQEKAKAPTGPALYIGLPTIAGFVIVMLIGTCWWNRKVRRIDVGSIMGRGRRGYGVAKSRARRMGRRDRKEGIRLMEREVGEGGPPEQQYRDEDGGHPRRRRDSDDESTGWEEHVPGRERDEVPAHYGVPRRDSDALGSLAGTPTEDRQMGFDRPGGGNVFRDELSRQERERS
ncbi:hypothetical protein NKR23_g11045 [Pleurostoma richardsiae]|uniref:Uncharacterized protein n=1 Tax=Pleurostoma richardsiae TaxID=41990 RepID=A0AA38RBH1_9PEZI|nr:hypothetical protein NKR23_g11045 [Pleurostoma richardsiae]